MDNRQRLVSTAILAFSLPTISMAAESKARPAKTQQSSDNHTASVTRTIMHEVLGSVKVVLPLSFDEEKFSSPAHRKEIQAHLGKLTQHVTALQSHLSGSQPDMEFPAETMGRDMRDLEELYRNERYQEARFMLHNMSTVCIACHTKLPDASPVHTDILALKAFPKDALSALDMAQFKIMTREFEQASTLYAEEFAKEPRLMDTRHFSDFSKLNIRVRNQVDPIIKVLSTGLDDKGLSKTQQVLFTKWLETAKTLKGVWADKSKAASKETAKEFLDKASKVRENHGAHAGLLYDIAASAILNRTIENTREPKELSELYYLSGLSEINTTDSFWFSELEHHFEQAIRLAPSSPWAPKALATLKQEFLLGYTGSAGTHIPPEIKGMLQELEALIEGAPKM